MGCYQKIVIMGRLGKDPETAATKNGGNRCVFSVAVDEGSVDKKQTEWFTVVCFDKLADLCKNNLRKGFLVLIEGKLRTRSWEGTGGQTNYRTDLVAHLATFIDRIRNEDLV